jgi:hypothetical protein
VGGCLDFDTFISYDVKNIREVFKINVRQEGMNNGICEF